MLDSISDFSIFVGAVVVLAVVIIILGVKTVPQGYNYTVERFGRYSRTLTPGLAIIVPMVDRIGREINMMEQVLDVPTQEVITRDNAMVAVRTVMGSMDLDEMLSKRDEINVRLLRIIDEATTPWGVKVTRVEIKDIRPPMDLVESMARQMKAERDKRAQILDAEGDKQSAILRADGEKQGAILQAEGRREAAFRDAEARERAAEAEAKATTSVSEAIGRGDMGAINYFIALKYVEALKELAGAKNQKVLMLPLDATGLMGSLAGIAEIAKDAFGDVQTRPDEIGRRRRSSVPVSRPDDDEA